MLGLPSFCLLLLRVWMILIYLYLYPGLISGREKGWIFYLDFVGFHCLDKTVFQENVRKEEKEEIKAQHSALTNATV